MTEQAVREGVDLVLGRRRRRHHPGDLLRPGRHRRAVRADPGRNRQPAGPEHRHSAGRGGGPGRRLRRGGQGRSTWSSSPSTAGPPDHFAVMAGIGIDAVIMEGTDPNLKKAVGSAAYFVSAAQARQSPGAADHHPGRRRATGQAPGARDRRSATSASCRATSADPRRPGRRRLLDVLVASPRTAADWVRITTQVLTRRKRTDAQIDRLTGSKVTISGGGAGSVPARR